MKIDFAVLTPEEADAFCAHVVARENARLGDLARWVEATSGTLNELDFSVGSLVPLWTWFIDFVRADCPGVPVDATTLTSIAFDDPVLDAGFRRAFYASESLQHYVLRVVQQSDPGAHWAVFRTDRRDMDYQRTRIRSETSNGYTGVDASLVSFAADILEGDPRGSAPTGLVAAFELLFWWVANAPKFASADGPLSSYLSHNVAIDDPVRVPPRFAPPERVIAAASNRSELAAASEMLLADLRADIESLESAVPLREPEFLLALAQLGFTTSDGLAITVSDLAAENSQLMLTREDREVALIETVGSAQRLRALSVAAVEASQSEWDIIVSAFESVADAEGVRFATEDEF